MTQSVAAKGGRHKYEVFQIELFLDFRQKRRFDEIESASVGCTRACLAWMSAVRTARACYPSDDEVREWITARPEVAGLLPITVAGIVEWVRTADVAKTASRPVGREAGPRLVVPSAVDPAGVSFDSLGKHVRIPYFTEPVRFKQNHRITYNPDIAADGPSEGKVKKNAAVKSMWLQTCNNRRCLVVDCRPQEAPAPAAKKPLTKVTRDRKRAT